jgi:SAM-dependent methyltransferase
MDTTKYMSFAKYGLTATLLKLSSNFPQFYRFLGNKFGSKRRVRYGIPSSYGKRAKKFLSWYEKYQMIKDSDVVLEIGTGWIHFESVVIRLFYDVETTLFDVWDNRQLDALKKIAVQLERLLYQEIDLSQAQKQRIKQLIEVISRADSFDNLYQSLNFQYLINANGTLEPLQDETFQLVYSNNVLEHVHRETAPRLVQDIYRVLKPGGFSCHEIDLTDHLVSFAGIHDLPEKYYLRFSDKTWERFFENKVQYINRIQCSEWLDLFQQAGLELVEKEIITGDIDTIKVSKTYNRFEKHDLVCKRLGVILRKPLLHASF